MISGLLNATEALITCSWRYFTLSYLPGLSFSFPHYSRCPGVMKGNKEHDFALFYSHLSGHLFPCYFWTSHALAVEKWFWKLWEKVSSKPASEITTTAVDGIWVLVRWWNIQIFSAEVEATHKYTLFLLATEQDLMLLEAAITFGMFYLQVSGSLKLSPSRPFLCSAHCLSSALSLWTVTELWQDHLCGHFLFQAALQSLSPHFPPGGNMKPVVITPQNWTELLMTDFGNMKEDGNSNNHGQNNCEADLQITRIITLLHF